MVGVLCTYIKIANHFSRSGFLKILDYFEANKPNIKHDYYL